MNPDVEKAVNLLKTSKLTMAEIARQTNCTVYQIRKYKHFLNVKRGINLYLLNKLIYDKTKTQKEIALLCNCSQSTVHRKFLKIHGNKTASVQVEKAILALKDEELRKLNNCKLAKVINVHRQIISRVRKQMETENELNSRTTTDL